MAYLIKRFLGFRIGAGSGEPTPGARMLPAIPGDYHLERPPMGEGDRVTL